MLQYQKLPYVANNLANEAFKTLLNKIAGRFPSRTALAKALNITPSRLSRALNTGDFPFNVENCLRLAKVSGEPPSEVLRAADNGEIAELIESLYGPEKTVTDPAIVTLLTNWDDLTDNQRTFARSAAEMLLLARLQWPERTDANVPVLLDVGASLGPVDPPVVKLKPRRSLDAKKSKQLEKAVQRRNEFVHGVKSGRNEDPIADRKPADAAPTKRHHARGGL